MPVFSANFLARHVIVLDGNDANANAPRRRKLAFNVFIHRYYRNRAMNGNQGTRISTSLFFTVNSYQEFCAYSEKLLQSGSKQITYPDPKLGSLGLQKVDAVVTVADRNITGDAHRLYQGYNIQEGFNEGNWPKVVFEALGGPLIDHFASITLGAPPVVTPFSLGDYRALNAKSTLDGSDEMWIQPLI